MKKLFVLAFVAVILAGCTAPSIATKKKTITINEHVWTVETAATPAEQELGLSNRESLAPDTGMYFVFNDIVDRTFWMKNMKFPLDIVWILNDEVIKVDYDAMPEGENPANFYYSKEAVNRVLEINNGDAMKYDIKPGDKIKIDE